MTKKKVNTDGLARNVREIRNQNGKKVAEIDYDNNIVVISKATNKTIIHFTEGGLTKIENI